MNTAHRPPAPAAWGEFLTLPENRSAVRAAKGLAKALLAGRRPPVTPLVLHGPPGTGKTHLTATLLKRIARGPEVVTAQSVSVGDLARVAVDAETPGFADADLIACDLLVLEDVQLLPDRATNAVCGLIDRRASRRKAVMVTANAGPAGLEHLSRKLTSRLASGLVLQLGPLSAASRRVVLEAAAASRRIRLTDDALDYLAGQTTGGGVRALLGLLGNLAPAAANSPVPLDRTATEEALARTGQPTSNGRDMPAIVKRVAAAFGVTERELLGVSRLRRVLVPRQVAMYLARELCGLSLPRIGTAFDRDHTTVLHACRKVEAELVEDERLAGTVRQLRAELS